MRLLLAIIVLVLSPGLALADFAKIEDEADFLKVVAGKTLKRPFVALEVTADGMISGRGARWDVTGNWSWSDGYFCRVLIWGGDDLGYNCQEVRAKDGRIRFTSDRGEGRSAIFRVED